MNGAAKAIGPYMTIDEAAEYLRLKPSTLYQKSSQRLIPSRKHFGKLVFVTAELDAWSAAQNKPKDLVAPSQSLFQSARERVRSLKIQPIASMPNPEKGA